MKKNPRLQERRKKVNLEAKNAVAKTFKDADEKYMKNQIPWDKIRTECPKAFEVLYVLQAFGRQRSKHC